MSPFMTHEFKPWLVCKENNSASSIKDEAILSFCKSLKCSLTPFSLFPAAQTQASLFNAIVDDLFVLGDDFRFGEAATAASFYLEDGSYLSMSCTLLNKRRSMIVYLHHKMYPAKNIIIMCVCARRHFRGIKIYYPAAILNWHVFPICNLSSIQCQFIIHHGFQFTRIDV